LARRSGRRTTCDFGNPINLVPLAAGIVIGIGNVSLKFSDSFTLSGIALGTIVAVGLYHLARWLAPKELRDASDGAALVYDPPGAYADADTDLEADKADKA